MKRYNSQYPMYMNVNALNDCPCKGYMPTNESKHEPKNIQEPMEEYEEYDHDEIDREYMKSMYPDLCKRIQQLVEDECDQLEYEGSWMYDEHPDKKEIEKIVARIYIVVEQDQGIPKIIQEVETKENDIDAQQVIVPGRNNWLWDNSQVQFVNEMFNRRRHRYPRRYNYFYQPYYYPYQYYPYQYYPYQYYQTYQPYLIYQPYVPYYYRNY